MSNQTEDIQVAGSDTRPPMLDMTNFESWKQQIQLYCKGKIMESTYFRDICKLINHNRDAKDIWDNVKMLLEGSELTKDDHESQLFMIAVKLNRGLKESNPDQSYAYLNQHELHANENKMLVERLNQHSHDPLALVSNVSPYQYLSSSSVPPQPSYISPVTYQPQFTDNTQLDTMQNGRVVVQNVQGRQNRVQGNNTRGTVMPGNGGAQYKASNTTARQGKPTWMRSSCFFLTGGQPNTFDDEVDEGPVQDMAQNEDNIFQVDQCDAFNSDVDEAPTAQTMFMANLSSTDPVYNEAGPWYDTDTLSEDNEDQVVHGDVSSVPNDADTLKIAETIRKKMIKKMEDPECFVLTVSRFSDMHNAYTVAQKRMAKLEAENSNMTHKIQKDDHDEMIKHFSKLETTALLIEIKTLKAQIKGKTKYVTMPTTVKLKVLAPGIYDIDVEQIPPRNRNNMKVHLDYLKHLKGSVATLCEIVKEAEVEKPLDSSLASACLYTKHSQELLVYVIGTCPKDFNKRDGKIATAPLNRKKRVTFMEPDETLTNNS
uniref:Integrase, catalytic region, zinc finger, CCHC-type, peptidase aspartic, catalytic n=1 Tax=Tanacetum cinerariifolium TaxID=118510 RepID=A0A6L2JQR3_TANCI|nr:hypothetical protein [Tanacetum cinerariifolium]